MLGFVLGAGVAAWAQRLQLPLKHGIICAVGTYIAAQAVFIIVRSISGNEIRWLAALFNLTAVAVAGLIGGALGGMLQRTGFLPVIEQRFVMSILVIDVGTSGLRAAVVDGDGVVHALEYRPFPPSSPFPGLVEFDGQAMADAVLDVATRSLATAGPVAAVGITNQRASTLGVGSQHRSTDRSGPRLAGPAHRVRLHHRQEPSTGWRWHPTSRPPRSPGC